MTTLQTAFSSYHWTVRHTQHKTGLTPLDCQPFSTQNWTGLDWTVRHIQHKIGLC
ncbi:hypothetical protein K443DRAFT_104694 [Laccaria amethystina LaAM-08-1]|uniref:Uncharacterized protein n=1 Tax=Laccaria amethystina LaAM-08-1 TaxID=1095629 RepID=A0A0C9X9C5_9AGAR|nr:hypothetical protein K443DRAFT_104694 [Laccaria amethystina LaAM-08-1]